MKKYFTCNVNDYGSYTHLKRKRQQKKLKKAVAAKAAKVNRAGMVFTK
jgi:hypothetical protein